MRVRKKPIEVEAMLWTGNNLGEIKRFVGDSLVVEYAEIATLTEKRTVISGISIKTLEGELQASVGDYIIKGVQGEFYPCKPDIFKGTYDIVDENN